MRQRLRFIWGRRSSVAEILRGLDPVLRLDPQTFLAADPPRPNRRPHDAARSTSRADGSPFGFGDPKRARRWRLGRENPVKIPSPPRGGRV